jgi:hypothetical protein
LAQVSTALCFTDERIAFIDATGAIAGKPTQGQTFFYLGPNRHLFERHFSAFGLLVATI